MKTKLLSFFLFIHFLCAVEAIESQPVIRAAIEIGMGGPKLHVAAVDPIANKVIKNIYSEKFFVNFHDGIENDELSQAVMATGLLAFKQAVEKASAFDPQKIIAIATSALRLTKNGPEFAKKIEAETKIPITIVDQILEGKITFVATASKKDIAEKNLVVWDIGGGSTQFITEDNGSFKVDCSSIGSGSFRDYIIQEIQKKDPKCVKSPNPMSAEEIAKALMHAQKLARSVNQLFFDKITKPQTQVIGAGSVFSYGIAETVGHKQHISIEDLSGVVAHLPGKTDLDLGGNDFATVEGSNAILVLGFMQALGIQKMEIVKLNNADGLLIYPAFWKYTSH